MDHSTSIANLGSIRASKNRPQERPGAAPFGNLASPKDLERLAHWLDSVIGIPGTGVRFGLDALLGLLPGVGDTASALASMYILQAATKFGVPRITIARMTLNIIVDLLVGAFPIVGDLFDVYWKANRRNVELLRRHLQSNSSIERKLKRSDGWFVAGMIALIGVILIASVAAAYFILTWAFESVSQLTKS
jgi:hypothetical protein